IIRLLFERGEFHAADTHLMTPLLMIYALGLPFLSFNTLPLRGFYALKDTVTPVRAAVLSSVLNLPLSIILMQWLSTAALGLAAASGLAMVAQSWFLQSRLSRRLPRFGLAPLLPNLGKSLVAGALGSAAVWAGVAGIARLPLPEKAHEWVAVLGLIPAACAL